MWTDCLNVTSWMQPNFKWHSRNSKIILFLFLYGNKSKPSSHLLLRCSLLLSTVTSSNSSQTQNLALLLSSSKSYFQILKKREARSFHWNRRKEEDDVCRNWYVHRIVHGKMKGPPDSFFLSELGWRKEKWEKWEV